jgi:hypothetical protein
MNDYQVSEEGLEQNLFVNYKKVISGHYHNFSETKNIIYPGIAYHLNFNDADHIKQFTILDLETDKIKFIPNPYKLFHKIEYDDQHKDYSNLDFEEFRNSYVKIYIKNKTRPIILEKLLDNLQKVNVHDYKIVEQASEYDTLEEAFEDFETEDTIQIVNQVIESLENIDHESVKKLILEIYHESIQSSIQ